MSRTTTVPMHPELVADQPQTVRWVLAPGVVPFAGPVRRVPQPLGALVDDGVIQAIVCESCAVLIRLADGLRWTDVIGQVRDALEAAVDAPGWQPYDAEQGGPDALLAAAVREVLAGPAGDYVRSHGGEVTVASVADGRVEVTFSGTCGHCPATGITLHDRLEAEVRRKHPALRAITATNAGGHSTPRFLSIRRRRDC